MTTTMPTLRAAALALSLTGTLACTASFHVHSQSSPPRLAPKYLDSVAIEPALEGRAFEELAIIGVVTTKDQRDAALVVEAAALGADAIIDIEAFGKIPVFYIMMIPIHQTAYAATAIRWTE